MVIQRWQSLLLLIAIVVMAIFSFVSLGEIQGFSESLNFTTLGFSIEGASEAVGSSSRVVLSTWPLFIVSLMSAILSLIALFSYRNLKRQKMICAVTLLFICTTICLTALYAFYSFEGTHVSFSSSVVAPFIALFALVGAIKCIVSDERKLRAIDHIR